MKPTVIDRIVMVGAALVAALVLLLIPPTGDPAMPGYVPGDSVTEWSLPGVVSTLLPEPCEDDAPSMESGAQFCYWNAEKHGNGYGTSFVYVNGTYVHSVTESP